MDSESLLSLSAHLPAPRSRLRDPHASPRKGGTSTEPAPTAPDQLLDLPRLRNLFYLPRVTPPQHHVRVSYRTPGSALETMRLLGADTTSLRPTSCLQRGACCRSPDVRLPHLVDAAAGCDVSALLAAAETYVSKAVPGAGSVVAVYDGFYGETSVSEVLCRQPAGAGSVRDDLKRALEADVEAAVRKFGGSPVSGPAAAGGAAVARSPLSSAALLASTDPRGALDAMDAACMLSILNSGPPTAAARASSGVAAASGGGGGALAGLGRMAAAPPTAFAVAPIAGRRAGAKPAAAPASAAPLTGAHDALAAAASSWDAGDDLAVSVVTVTLLTDGADNLVCRCGRGSAAGTADTAPTAAGADASSASDASTSTSGSSPRKATGDCRTCLDWMLSRTRVVESTSLRALSLRLASYWLDHARPEPGTMLLATAPREVAVASGATPRGELHQLLQSALLARALVGAGAYGSPLTGLLEPFTARSLQRLASASAAGSMSVGSVDFVRSRHVEVPVPRTYSEARDVVIALQSRVIHVADGGSDPRPLATHAARAPLQSFVEAAPSVPASWTIEAAFPSFGVSVTLTVSATAASPAAADAPSAPTAPLSLVPARSSAGDDAVLRAILGSPSASGGATGTTAPCSLGLTWRLAVTDAHGDVTERSASVPAALQRVSVAGGHVVCCTGERFAPRLRVTVEDASGEDVDVVLGDDGYT